MSDLDLSTALTDLASNVELVDITDHVNAAISRRRRRRAVATVAATVVAVLAVVGGSITIADRGGQPTPSTRKPSPTPTPSTKPLALKARLPQYVPAAAHLIRETSAPDHYPTAAVYQAVWQANRAHIRFSIVDDRELKPCPRLRPGPGFDPRHTKVPCGPDTGWFYAIAPLAEGYPQSINGRTAHVANEHPAGIQDIEWREGPFHYLLVSNRLTPGGGPLTGLPFAEIVKMARSVRSDPTVPTNPALPNPPGLSIPTSALDGFTYWHRELLAANGALVSYLRGGAHFDVYLEPVNPSPAAMDLTSDNSAQGVFRSYRRQGGKVLHVTVAGQSAVALVGPQDVRVMRYRIPNYRVLFFGRYGATIADYKRIARAMRVIPHLP